MTRPKEIDSPFLMDVQRNLDQWIVYAEEIESQLKESKKDIERANIHIQKMNERDQEILELKAQLQKERIINLSLIEQLNERTS